MSSIHKAFFLTATILATLSACAAPSTEGSAVDQLWNRYGTEHSYFGFNGCISGSLAYIKTADRSGQARLSVLDTGTLSELAHYTANGFGPIQCTEKAAVVSVTRGDGQTEHWRITGKERSQFPAPPDCILAGQLNDSPVCLRDINYDGTYEISWHTSNNGLRHVLTTSALGASEGEIIALPYDTPLFVGIFYNDSQSVSLRIFDAGTHIIRQSILPCASPSLLQTGSQVRAGCGKHVITLAP